MLRLGIAFASAVASLAFAIGCKSGDEATAPAHAPSERDARAMTQADGPNTGPDFEAQATDFECILDWTKVRHFYITNKAGNMDETLAIANSTSGGVYPVGTIIQLIPQEAMVKRGAGFSAQTKDWEFFSLQPSATDTQILARGTTHVQNQFNANCLDCHQKARPEFDMVCENTHGCDPLGLPENLIASLQSADPRCRD
jgi:hypothetical protein